MLELCKESRRSPQSPTIPNLLSTKQALPDRMSAWWSEDVVLFLPFFVLERSQTLIASHQSSFSPGDNSCFHLQAFVQESILSLFLFNEQCSLPVSCTRTCIRCIDKTLNNNKALFAPTGIVSGYVKCYHCIYIRDSPSDPSGIQDNCLPHNFKPSSVLKDETCTFGCVSTILYSRPTRLGKSSQLLTFQIQVPTNRIMNDSKANNFRTTIDCPK
jgi:hypothetical protein